MLAPIIFQIVHFFRRHEGDRSFATGGRIALTTSQSLLDLLVFSQKIHRRWQEERPTSVQGVEQPLAAGDYTAAHVAMHETVQGV